MQNLTGHSGPPHLGVRLAIFGHAVKQGQDKSDVLKTVLVGDGMQKRPELQGSDLRVNYHRSRWNPVKDNRREDKQTTWCIIQVTDSKSL